MSDTSIQFKDEGYTSPEFITNLFRKPLYSSINISTFDTNSTLNQSSSSKQNNIPTSPTKDHKHHSPLKFKNYSNVPKFYRSHSLIDDDKISNKKFKIFFKSFMHNSMSQEQLDQMWQSLETAMKNPFEFDKFIDNVRAQRQMQKNNRKQNEQIKIQVFKVSRKVGKSVGKSKQTAATNIRFLSHQKSTQIRQTDKDIKNKMREETKIMRLLLTQGERFIKQKN